MNTETYKKTHRPHLINEEKSGKPHQGFYIPKHPEKVIGGEIITRSSWESAFARWCDDNPNVIEWGCETCCIQYRNPSALDFSKCQKMGVNPLNPEVWPIHNYYPDFYCCLKNTENPESGDVKKLIIEIKPKYQTEKPVPPPQNAKLSENKRFNNLTKTYLQNVKKWEAAMEWCKNHGFEFRVFTEVTLQKMGII